MKAEQIVSLGVAIAAIIIGGVLCENGHVPCAVSTWAVGIIMLVVTCFWGA